MTRIDRGRILDFANLVALFAKNSGFSSSEGLIAFRVLVYTLENLDTITPEQMKDFVEVECQSFEAHPEEHLNG